MTKNKSNSEIAFNKLLSLLISPNSGDKLVFDSDTKTLKDTKGYKYSVESFIPILLAKNIESLDFNYIEHYKTDSELFDYFEERTGGTLHDELRVRQYILSRIDSNIKSILDVGCGRAWLAGELSVNGVFVCSLDASLTNPAKALELYPNENHAGIVADAVNLPFSENSFDSIVASEIIEHIVEPQKFVHELMRCLKPGGKLIITTPYKEVLRYSLCIHCNKMTPVNAHLHTFDEIKLKNLYKSDSGSFKWSTFGNKALLHLRTHVVLKYLPFSLWKAVDSFFSLFINKQAHIIAVYTKDKH
jgi:2-polyprenyl-3-methyl-5-hydroxy-6-metoxy-1,4-benzoquinol methylase